MLRASINSKLLSNVLLLSKLVLTDIFFSRLRCIFICTQKVSLKMLCNRLTTLFVMPFILLLPGNILCSVGFFLVPFIFCHKVVHLVLKRVPVAFIHVSDFYVLCYLFLQNAARKKKLILAIVGFIILAILIGIIAWQAS